MGKRHGMMESGTMDTSKLMAETMGKMSGMMKDMPRGDMKKMSGTMNEMSHQIWGMAWMMGSGKSTPAEMKKMQHRMNEIQRNVWDGNARVAMAVAAWPLAPFSYHWPDGRASNVLVFLGKTVSRSSPRPTPIGERL
jgi:hypothetical protein